MKLQETVFSR